jgi:ABC-type branched-subunit amino acid transport system ATPase component
MLDLTEVRAIACGSPDGCTLLGKNGMGKSTLLKMIMGFLPVRSGGIRLFGEDITGLPPHPVARKAIAYTPLEQALFQDLTVEQNLRLRLRTDRDYAGSLARVGTSFLSSWNGDASPPAR